MTIPLTQCNRDEWIEGLWTLMIGCTILFSSVFGMVRGKNLYAFASDASMERLQEI
jgi:hypothetical protein